MPAVFKGPEILASDWLKVTDLFTVAPTEFVKVLKVLKIHLTCAAPITIKVVDNSCQRSHMHM